MSDTALPGFAAALDCEAMRGALAAAAACHAASLTDCAIERIKYRPGRSALVLYRVTVEEASQTREALFYATVYPAGTKLRAFPDDRKLPGLRLLGDAERVRAELLPEVTRVRWDGTAEPRSCSVSRVSYFPEHSYTARVGVDLGEGPEWALYAKTHFTSCGARTFAALRGLWESRARREEHLQHARPVLYQSAASALWQEALSGSTLEELAARSELSEALAARVGRAVAALHGSTCFADLASRDAGSSLARLHEVLRVITAMLPHLAPCARRIVERLEQRAPYGEAARATLHGDLHLHNILVDRGRVALVDMDDLCRGPAELELGSFVAALSYRAALHGDPAMHDAAAARFLEGYRENAPRPVCPAHVRWYAAAALIHERTWRCLTSLKPGRLERIEGLLSAAGALAA